jgi:hypothetical protein
VPFRSAPTLLGARPAVSQAAEAEGDEQTLFVIHTGSAGDGFVHFEAPVFLVPARATCNHPPPPLSRCT